MQAEWACNTTETTGGIPCAASGQTTPPAPPAVRRDMLSGRQCVCNSLASSGRQTLINVAQQACRPHHQINNAQHCCPVATAAGIRKQGAAAAHLEAGDDLLKVVAQEHRALALRHDGQRRLQHDGRCVFHQHHVHHPACKGRREGAAEDGQEPLRRVQHGRHAVRLPQRQKHRTDSACMFNHKEKKGTGAVCSSSGSRGCSQQIAQSSML